MPRFRTRGSLDAHLVKLLEKFLKQMEIELHDFVDGLKVLLHILKNALHVAQLGLRTIITRTDLASFLENLPDER